LVAAAQASAQARLPGRIPSQEAAQRLRQCGLQPVTIRFNDPEYGGEDILVATGVKAATDQQLRCADKAANYFILELSPDIERRFEALREARLAPILEAKARAWLSDKGLLGRVPRYSRGKTNEGTFTRQVEELCGPKAHGAFQSQYGFHAVSPDWIKRNLDPPDKSEDALICLMNVTTVAGFEIGFIGNEYSQ
jgi:hypothetical protein